MGDFNFKKLISLEERVFSLYGGEGNRGQVIWGTVIMVIKAGYDSGQNNNHTITFCFHGKATFIVTFKEKNKK